MGHGFWRKSPENFRRGLQVVRFCEGPPFVGPAPAWVVGGVPPRGLKKKPLAKKNHGTSLDVTLATPPCKPWGLRGFKGG